MHPAQIFARQFQRISRFVSAVATGKTRRGSRSRNAGGDGALKYLLTRPSAVPPTLVHSANDRDFDSHAGECVEGADSREVANATTARSARRDAPRRKVRRRGGHV